MAFFEKFKKFEKMYFEDPDEKEEDILKGDVNSEYYNWGESRNREGDVIYINK